MPTAHHGTLAFLFTDIEGSTRLWQEHPEAMRLALAQHDETMRTAIEECSGTVFKTVGDAFHAVFERASDGIAAAARAQLALQAVSNDGDMESLRVRMALHAGEVEARDDDFFGPPLNRCARLLATGHGEQILISRVVEELVRYTLADGFSIRDLGDHQLRDLSQPEHIFQLLHPDLRAEFPAVNSVDHYRTNLPVEVTSFVGREREIEEITAQRKSARLLTLTGVGGAGKTRLSLHVAAEAIEGYPDGVWVVELAEVASSELVVSEIMAALGVRERPGQPALSALVAHIRPSRLLLLLDNCEHVIDAAAHAANAILRDCPDVHIIATSREALGVPGEVTWRVPSLDAPAADDNPPVADLLQYGAVQLFVDRAKATRPDFDLTDENAAAVAQICRRLDGIPLAIELAAARVRMMSPDQIAHRLSDRFRLLTGGSRVALRRQQTLQALIDWSYELLTDLERVLFCRLSVFSGGFTLEAAEVVAADDSLDEWEILDLLTQLVAKSLVAPEDDDPAHPRYHLLESLRDYAQIRLIESGGTEAVRRRFMKFFAERSSRAKDGLRGGEQEGWGKRIDADHANMQAALAWALECDPDTALRMVSDLWRYWKVRGYWTEGLEWHERALDGAEGVSPAPRAEALIGAGKLALDQGHADRAERYHTQGLQIYADIGDAAGIARAKGGLGNIAYSLGDLDSARKHHGEALEAYRQCDDRRAIATTLGNLANIADAQHELDEGRDLRDEMLAIYHELGDRELEAHYLCDIGWMDNFQGEYDRAQGHLAAALDISRALGNRYEQAHCLNSLGLVAANRGQYDDAEQWHRQALHIHQEMGGRAGEAVSLQDLGSLARVRGDLSGARSLYDQALRIWGDLGIDKLSVDPLVGLACIELTEGRPEAAARGCIAAMGLASEQGNVAAIALCLEGLADTLALRSGALDAANVLAAAEGLRRQANSALPGLLRDERSALVDALRDRVGHAEFERIRAEWRGKSVEEAVEYAQSCAAPVQTDVARESHEA